MSRHARDTSQGPNRCQELAHECQLLRDRLEIALQYLHSFNLYYRAEGLDYTPRPWGITVQTLLNVLESDNPIESLNRAHAEAKRPQS